MAFLNKNLNTSKDNTSLPTSVEEILYDAFRHNIFISQILGYFPVSLKPSTQTTSNRFPLLSSILIIGICMACGAVSVSHAYDHNKYWSATFQLVYTAWSIIIFTTPSISRFSLIICQHKVSHLWKSCVKSMEIITAFLGTRDHLIDFCAKLKTRYIQLISFYTICLIICSSMTIPSAMKSFNNPTFTNLAEDVPLILLCLIYQFNFFVFLGQDFFCQIYNHCCDVIIQSVQVRASRGQQSTKASETVQLAKTTKNIFTILNKVADDKSVSELSTNDEFITGILESFSLIEEEVEKCNDLFELRMIVEIFYYFSVCIFNGYFGIQFVVGMVSFRFIFIQIIPIFASGYSIYCVARLSTNLSRKTFQLFNQLAKLGSCDFCLNRNIQHKVIFNSLIVVTPLILIFMYDLQLQLVTSTFSGKPLLIRTSVFDLDLKFLISFQKSEPGVTTIPTKV
ncbi:uncharacterized protein LOC118435099 isoform X2 [Folsomia candida]|uniref:uncharacterized protein LOC118435099 isoform X2 n=1 Tax=Folsomia candida TaxID=158441 RepID=UPI001605040F|nr:uncharacterized protein LOC118435099 isoform X2 [Folsomia candida]